MYLIIVHKYLLKAAKKMEADSPQWYSVKGQEGVVTQVISFEPNRNNPAPFLTEWLSTGLAPSSLFTLLRSRR